MMKKIIPHRELTRAERAAIRKLVKDLCVNYDHEYGCLLLNGDCYMFYGVAYTNTGMCKYFRNAILPIAPVIEAMLKGGEKVETRSCGICDRAFLVNGKKNTARTFARAKRNADNSVNT